VFLVHSASDPGSSDVCRFLTLFRSKGIIENRDQVFVFSGFQHRVPENSGGVFFSFLRPGFVRASTPRYRATRDDFTLQLLFFG